MVCVIGAAARVFVSGAQGLSWHVTVVKSGVLFGWKRSMDIVVC